MDRLRFAPRPALVLALALLASSMALPALAADEQAIADQLTAQGYYLEGVTSSETESVRSVVTRFSTDDPSLVVLEEDVEDAGLLADAILARMEPGTVIVLTPSLIGAASDFYDDGQLDRAIDASLDAFESDYGQGLADFRAALSGSTEPAGDGGGFPTALVVVVVLVAGGFAFVLWRNRRRHQAALEEDLEEAKSAVGEQVAVVANEILELSDRVGESAEAEELFRQASATFAAVEEALPNAATVAAVERLGEQLDDARWQLEVTEAKLEGRTPPPKPTDRPARCFFDPNHRAGTEEALIETSAGSQTVSVCRACRSKLTKGERVQPRPINVGGRAVPAPRAPKSYGGGGFDWLDVFSVVVGGTNVAYDMSRRRGSTRRRAPSLGGAARRRSSPSRSTARIGRSRSSARVSRSRSRSRGRSSRRR